MKKIYLAAALCAIFLPLSTQASGVSFHQARALMTQRADTLKMSQADIDQKQQQVKESRSLRGPKISLNAQQIEGRKDIHMAFDNPLAGASGMIGQALPIPGLSEMLGQNKFKIDLEEDISGPRASIDMVWPIYTGGAISAQQKASEAALRQARASHGAQVNRDAAEREYIGSQTDRKVAETELADLLREESVGRLNTPMFVSKDLKTLSYWQDRALANNPILKALDAQHEQARMGVQAAKSTYHPQLYLFGHYNMIKHYLTLPEPDWIAGIGVSFTLWDNRDRSARLGSARALADKAHAAKNQAQAEIRRVVEVAWLRSKDALEQYDLTVSSIELARENLRLRDKSFRDGLSTVDDVNDARNKLIAAQVAQRVAAYRFVVAYSLLHATSGRMMDFMNAFGRPDVIAIEQ